MYRDPTANKVIKHIDGEERKRVRVVREARRRWRGEWFASEDEVRRFVEMVERL